VIGGVAIIQNDSPEEDRIYDLYYLTSLNVLARQDDEYSLSPEAATSLVRGKKSYIGDLIIDFTGPVPWDSIRESIRSGSPRNFKTVFAGAWHVSGASRGGVNILFWKSLAV
jgi:hypothetical protein